MERSVDYVKKLDGNKVHLKNNIHCHPGDAYANGIAVLTGRPKSKKQKQQSIQQRQKMARSYRGGNYSRKIQEVNVMQGV